MGDVLRKTEIESAPHVDVNFPAIAIACGERRGTRFESSKVGRRVGSGDRLRSFPAAAGKGVSHPIGFPGAKIE